MSKAKVEGKGITAFELELKDLNLTERAEINDMISDETISKNFTFWLDIIRKGTILKDDEIHKYSNEEIYAIGSKIILEMNKKK